MVCSSTQMQRVIDAPAFSREIVLCFADASALDSAFEEVRAMNCPAALILPLIRCRCRVCWLFRARCSWRRRNALPARRQDGSAAAALPACCVCKFCVQLRFMTYVKDRFATLSTVSDRGRTGIGLNRAAFA